MYVPIVMHGLRLFNVVLTTLFTDLYTYSYKRLLSPHQVPLHYSSVSVCSLRLFAVVFQELHYLPNCLHVCVI